MARKIKNGFTLIEMIMAIVLLGLIAVTTGLFSSQQLISTSQSGEYTIAQNLARMELERLQNLAYTSLTTGTVTTSNYQSYGYDVVTTISYVFGNDASAESLKQIVIQVRKSGSSSDLARLVTYIAKNITYGL
jgi:prepilin-type N-terminal cleavage/methylation domain-containing protein